jgi:hypothetical protein
VEEIVMTTQPTTQGRPVKQGVWTQLTMTAISLVVLGGIVLWHVRPGGEGTTAPVPGNAAHRTVTEGTTPVGGLAEPEPAAVSDQKLDQRSRPASTTLRTDTSDALDDSLAALPDKGLVIDRAGPAGDVQRSIYLVGSEEEADLLRARSDEGSAIRDALGIPESPLRLAWFDSPEAEAHFRRGIGETDAVHAALGEPPTTIIDLRAWSVAPCTEPAGSSDIARTTCS